MGKSAASSSASFAASIAPWRPALTGHENTPYDALVDG